MSAKRAQSVRQTTTSSLDRSVLAQTRTPAFKRYLRDLLVELCRIDTTPNPEVAKMRAAEEGCFKIIERELAGLPFAQAGLERRPVNPGIKKHRHY